MAYLTKLVQSLEKYLPSSNILLLGDFNLPNVNWNLVAHWFKRYKSSWSGWDISAYASRGCTSYIRVHDKFI